MAAAIIGRMDRNEQFLRLIADELFALLVVSWRQNVPRDVFAAIDVRRRDLGLAPVPADFFGKGTN